MGHAATRHIVSRRIRGGKKFETHGGFHVTASARVGARRRLHFITAAGHARRGSLARPRRRQLRRHADLHDVLRHRLPVANSRHADDRRCRRQRHGFHGQRPGVQRRPRRRALRRCARPGPPEQCGHAQPLVFSDTQFRHAGRERARRGRQRQGYRNNLGGVGVCTPATFGSWTASPAAAAVPEPATLGLFGAALAAFGFIAAAAPSAPPAFRRCGCAEPRSAAPRRHRPCARASRAWPASRC